MAIPAVIINNSARPMNSMVSGESTSSGTLQEAKQDTTIRDIIRIELFNVCYYTKNMVRSVILILLEVRDFIQYQMLITIYKYISQAPSLSTSITPLPAATGHHKTHQDQTASAFRVSRILSHFLAAASH
jgi:hypothetical protein